jgi:hypothetical protein
MSLFFECCVLSGRSLCDGPIPRPEEFYRVCMCVIECYQVNNNPLNQWFPTSGHDPSECRRGSDVGSREAFMEKSSICPIFHNFLFRSK